MSKSSEDRKREIMLKIDALMVQMESVLPHYYRLTLIGRNTIMGDADFVLTRDDLRMARNSLSDLISQQEEKIAEIPGGEQTLH